jgi:hypothetical protein
VPGGEEVAVSRSLLSCLEGNGGQYCVAIVRQRELAAERIEDISETDVERIDA